MAGKYPPLGPERRYDSNFAIVPFSRTYDEAFTLLVEARNYLTWSLKNDRRNLNGGLRLVQFREEMRMTTRLIRAMAWLLSVRAVDAGEIGWDEAVDIDDLMVDLKICIEDRRDECVMTPPALLDLMERAQSLYMRVARMELQVAARSAP
ncbi:DUF1465 family protein [Thalassospira sp.]|uniref:DUF1465 family protein n=1 Tax=Thalassospira sp. TaxID=1912094 RepID=UPI002736CB9E|nr:DUF1465 family protein [Thalassospira sp.]MDP2699881.1 DUF1465 family protein [Thalassospira sp.]